MKITSDDYKREYVKDLQIGLYHLSFTRSPLTLPANTFQAFVIPMIEVSSDIDNEDEEIRSNYERRIINDIQFAAHIKPTGPIYFKPSSMCNPNRLGKLLKQSLPSTCYEPIFVVEIDLMNSEYYRLMYHKDSDQEEDIPSSWSFWNKIHAATNYSLRMEVALVISSDSHDDENEIAKWLGECISMVVFTNDCFLTNSKNYPVLSKQNQDALRILMQCCRPAIVIEPEDFEDAKVCHYRDYLRFQEKFTNHDDHSFEQDLPRFPLQPLKDNLDYGTYETFERDNAKYIFYQRAIEGALMDMVTEEEKVLKEIVIMVVGAGQGPLVRSALNASVKTKRKIKIVIVEKNPNAMNVLEAMMEHMWKKENIELIFGDMRRAEFEGSVDILVSELLGSFGDNELSPECLDGVQKYLKPTGISIPCDSISYLRPVMSKRVNSNIVRFYERKFDTKSSHPLEASWLVYFGSIYYIDDTKEVFKFDHPNRQIPIDNSRYKVLEFTTKVDCVLNGFSGYFTSKLYKNIELSIHPESHTQGMKSWYSIYFPLKEPVILKKDDRIEVAFWRKCDENKVWYEYQLIAPKESKIINEDGKVHPILL